MIYIIGGHGFVGSGYVRLFQRLQLDYQVVTRENFAQFAGTTCNFLINANGNSKKFLAKNEPLVDFDASVRSVAVSLTAFKARQYVLLSSGDVYPDPSSPETTREDQEIDVSRQSRYGLHKYLAELLVRGCTKDYLIFRLGGFVGPGIKKNAIYDMLTGAPVWLSPQSRLQFTSTDKAAELAWAVISKGVKGEIINLGARGMVEFAPLHSRIPSKSEFKPDAPTIQYELSVGKLSTISGMEIPSTFEEVDRFVAGWPDSARS